MAGRGIDIKDVSVVINYDMAKSIEGAFVVRLVVVRLVVVRLVVVRLVGCLFL